jgi:hypothetical protein
MTDEAEIVHEVEDFYRRYIDTWGREDPVEVALHYDRPHVHLSGERPPSTVTSDSDQDRWFQQVIAYEQPWARTGIDALQVFPMSRTLAQLVADISRYGKEGLVLEQQRVSYMLRRGDDGWKVMTYAAVEQPFSGPGRPRGVLDGS